MSDFSGLGVVPAVKTISLLSGKVLGSQANVPTVGIPVSKEKSICESDVPFYKNQTRLLIGNNIKLDPKSIEGYLAVDGYTALVKVLSEMKPEQVLDVVKDSNIRGRGGAGFPAGKKWEFTRNSEGDEKYVICNADEGEPGTFKDRALLTEMPDMVFEGMTVAGYAVGARNGILYLRGEYAYLFELLNRVIQDRREAGLLDIAFLIRQ